MNIQRTRLAAFPTEKYCEIKVPDGSAFIRKKTKALKNFSTREINK